MSTFADLGFPFPIFEAPASEATNYVGVGVCRLCEANDRPCLDLKDDDLIRSCPSCGAVNGLVASGRPIETFCRACEAPVSFPEQSDDDSPFLVCAECLRAGRMAIAKETEFGFVDWEEAVEGLTRHLPEPPESDQFEVVPIRDSFGARIPGESLWELLRSPGYPSWQGENWLFHCRRPMIYKGTWESIAKTHQHPDRPAIFKGLFADDDPYREWDHEEFEYGSPTLYIFQCRDCGLHRAHHDCD